MSKCHQCEAPVAFSAVLNTINPFKINCKQCKHAIILDKLSASIAVLVILVVSFLVLTYFDHIDNDLLYIAVPLALGVEVIYFVLIRAKLIKIKQLNE